MSTNFSRRWSELFRKSRSNMADEIAFGSTENKDNSVLFQDGCGCQLCLEKPAKYTCPRCNVKYCSLECYKCEKHMECSELFYKNLVMEALQDDVIDKKERKKMLEILKRHHEDKDEDVVEEEGGKGLEERLEGLNLDQDTEKIWNKLTETERREFGKAVDTGYIGSLVDLWMPWWVNMGQRSSNGDTSEISKNQKIKTSTTPKVLKNIPPLQTLLKAKAPSSDTKYNLINILYSYAYVCRFYNGCHYEFVQEAVDGLWKISAVLYHTVSFTSVDSALRSSIESSLQHKEFFNSEEFSLSVINDVSLLLMGAEFVNDELLTQSHFVEAALSDIYRLLTKGISIHKSDKTKSEVNDFDMNIAKSLWLAKKKVCFMLSWFHENQDVFTSLEPVLPLVAQALKLEFKQHQDQKTKIEKSRVCGNFRNRKLIEEI